MTNWFTQYLMKIARDKESEFGWIRVDINLELKSYMKKLTDAIDKEDIYTTQPDDLGWTYGIETDPHITLLYGLHNDSPKECQETLKGQKGGFFTVDGVSEFEKEKYDVLKLDVKSEDLHRLHELLKKETENTQSFPEYKPHLTLSYMKKGKGKKYIDLFSDSKYKNNDKYKFSEVVFEDKKNIESVIKL